MNYEEKPFQDCKSITIDELKGPVQRAAKSDDKRAAATACVYGRR